MQHCNPATDPQLAGLCACPYLRACKQPSHVIHLSSQSFEVRVHHVFVRLGSISRRISGQLTLTGTACLHHLREKNISRADPKF